MGGILSLNHSAQASAISSEGLNEPGSGLPDLFPRLSKSLIGGFFKSPGPVVGFRQ